jgi:hypothetical protein
MVFQVEQWFRFNDPTSNYLDAVGYIRIVRPNLLEDYIIVSGPISVEEIYFEVDAMFREITKIVGFDIRDFQYEYVFLNKHRPQY